MNDNTPSSGLISQDWPAKELWQLIDDLTATNTTHKEGDMSNKMKVNGVEVDVYEVNGVQCVDKEDAKVLIKTRFDTDLRTQVIKGKVKLAGQVTRIGNAKKNVYTLESVLACAAARHTRGTDMKERFEIEMFPDVMKLAIKILEEEGGDVVKIQHVKDLIAALKAAKNLTAARRFYNESRKD